MLIKGNSFIEYSYHIPNFQIIIIYGSNISDTTQYARSTDNESNWNLRVSTYLGAEGAAVSCDDIFVNLRREKKDSIYTGGIGESFDENE